MNPLPQSTNDQIESRLRAGRRTVVKFLNQSQPFDLLTLRAVKRTCTLTDTGFVIRVVGYIQKVDGNLKKWLTHRPWPAFRQKGNGLWERYFGQDVRIVFYNANAEASQRWHVGYEITVPLRPQVPVPDAEDSVLEAFVLNVLWRRIMLNSRTQEWHRRQL